MRKSVILSRRRVENALSSEELLPGMTLRCRFRFGDFLGRLIAHPIGVENSRLVDALVGVCAKEVALRLQQIRRQTRGTIAIEVGQGSAEGWYGHAVVNRG